jgi:hypothetical protein
MVITGCMERLVAHGGLSGEQGCKYFKIHLPPPRHIGMAASIARLDGYGMSLDGNRWLLIVNRLLLRSLVPS